jgi:hypothetical protein
MSIPRPPVSDMLSAIPGALGIRLEKEPRHDIVERVGDVEIRRYAPAVLAQVAVEGPREHAMDRAFERLAGYIYGENADAEKMHMTTPVFQRDSGDATVPMQAQGSGDAWTIAFFLGNDSAVGDFPTPSDPGITLLELPAFLAATLQYSGNNTAEDRARARDKLLATLRDSTRWVPDDTVYWAQYDQPFAVPFLKRNEAQVAVREK